MAARSEWTPNTEQEGGDTWPDGGQDWATLASSPRAAALDGANGRSSSDGPDSMAVTGWEASRVLAVVASTVTGTPQSRCCRLRAGTDSAEAAGSHCRKWTGMLPAELETAKVSTHAQEENRREGGRKGTSQKEGGGGGPEKEHPCTAWNVYGNGGCMGKWKGKRGKWKVEREKRKEERKHERRLTQKAGG